MVDIRVGRVAPVVVSPSKEREREEAGVQGRVVSARPGRGSRAVNGLTEEERRGRGPRRDPVGSRVLTIVVPEGTHLPSDKELRDKRVILKIVD